MFFINRVAYFCINNCACAVFSYQTHHIDIIIINYNYSSWSKEVSYTTTGTVPTCPEPPRLIKATARNLTLQWQKSSPDISGYVLEMNDQANGYGFRPVFDGPDTKFTARNLDRNCHYQFRV